MKKILLTILTVIMFFGITGCSKEKVKQTNEDAIKELFMIGVTLDDGRVVHFTFDVPHINENNKTYLSQELSYNKINIDDFLNKLDYVDTLNDGGSKIYKYEKSKKEFGMENFYVVSCNSLDNIHDIFVAKNKDSLDGKCSIKINDLDGVSMTIKKGTLTNKGATVIITDISNRKNIYGESYELEKEENGVWIELEPKNEMFFNSIGYSVDNNHKLELKVDWEYGYGKLSKGKYRILKDTLIAGEGTKHYITAEFVID